ncbi:hypothetical protein SADUNF_Sadunf05G0103300 [Salix dunnii]|uniref:BHLH domain-containing protein n=1 Tax=Salix dunnii TaxID=1413687 RepID=A0A835K5J2_9ROSI|nr:hypothetical protein SADUNF_Sadunf05G0103300 [Salix dunnii]
MVLEKRRHQHYHPFQQQIANQRVMGGIYNNVTNNINNTCSASSSSRHHHRSSDDISLFLHQILLRSPSSTSSSSFIGPQTLQPFTVPAPSDHPLRSGVMLGVDSSDGGGSGLWSGNVTTRLIMSENETDHEGDWESEEVLKALTDEMSAKPALPRSSKRTRAAEVHNLSEKRRRRRINEKMKALQNLIPNSNKTDKASMLDEAIEYLKQLQLQVQMLSMRNGTILHPMVLPGVLQPLQLSQVRNGFDEEIGYKHMNMTTSVPLDGEAWLQAMFTTSNQVSIPNASNPIHFETSSNFQSSIHAHFSPFPFRVSAEENFWRKDILPRHPLNVSRAERSPSGGHAVPVPPPPSPLHQAKRGLTFLCFLQELELAAAATTSLPFGIRACDLKDRISLEARVTGRDQSEGVCLEIMEHNLMLSQNLNSTRTGRAAENHEIEIEKQDL